MRTKVYISGPMTAGDRVANFAQAVTAFRTLAKAVPAVGDPLKKALSMMGVAL